jgi:inosine/xanthosine triphosphatase
MRVIVGSENPVKIASVKRAFDRYFPNEKIQYIGQKTQSGVSDQPKSIHETIEGAVNRASNASSPDADFSVGIEGGISYYEIEGRKFAVEMGWVCVRDNKTGLVEIANSAGFSVFERVLKHIEGGKNLSDAMFDEYGLENLGQKNGYIGWLSNDLTTRETSNFEAVYLALCSLMKEEAL